jgi:hypothetical protein
MSLNFSKASWVEPASQMEYIYMYTVPGRRPESRPWVVSPLFLFAPGRFAPIPVRPGSFRPHLLIVL